MAFPIYVDIKGEWQGPIEGSCEMEGAEGTLVGYSFDSYTYPALFWTGSRNISIPVVEYISFTKERDKSTPKLYQAMCSGEKISAKVHFTKIDPYGVEVIYMMFDIKVGLIGGIKAKTHTVYLPENEPHRDTEIVTLYTKRMEIADIENSIFAELYTPNQINPSPGEDEFKQDVLAPIWPMSLEEYYEYTKKFNRITTERDRYGFARLPGPISKKKYDPLKALEKADRLAAEAATSGSGVINLSKKKEDVEPDYKVFELESGGKNGWNKELNKHPLESKAKYIVKPQNYVYYTDDQGRVNRVTGNLELEKHDRNTYQQRIAGATDGIKGGIRDDQGGHIIASMFNGPGEQINYVAMHKDLNQQDGGWAEMERNWAKALKVEPPQQVEVDIKIVYEGDGKRPVEFEADFWIDGKKDFETFKNR